MNENPEYYPLEEQRTRLNGTTGYIRSSYSNLHPIFTPNTTKQTRKTIKYFTIVTVMNAIMSAGWLSLVIWIGVVFADNANYNPEFLLTYLPVFLAMAVGLVVECIPLVIIIRALRNSQVVPFPTIQAECIFLVVSVFYVSAPVSLSSSLFARIDYSVGGCGHACGGAEAAAIAPLAAASVHLVSFVFRFWAILGVVRAS